MIVSLSGIEYSIESKHYVINTSATGKSCVLAIKSSGDNEKKIRFGLPFIRKQPLFFDMDNNLIAFLEKKTP